MTVTTDDRTLKQIESIKYGKLNINNGRNLVISLILNSLSDIIQSKQTLSDAVGTDPSHTQLAKNHADHHFNDLAGYMAYLVVRRIGQEMEKCWKGEISVESIINLVDQRYFVYPCDVDWIDDHIKKWAEDNSSKVKRGESKTIASPIIWTTLCQI